MIAPTPTGTAGRVERFTGFLIGLSGIVLMLMMAATIIDIFGRWLFGRALPGCTDLVSVGLALALALALPAVTWHGNHIALELLRGNPENPLERIRLAIVGLVSAAVFAALAVILFGSARQAAEYQDVIGYLQIPVAPMVYVLSVMALVAAVCFALPALGIQRSAPHLWTDVEDAE